MYPLKKGCCALHKCNVFAVMHSKECHKNIPNHQNFHHPEVIFFHFCGPAAFFPFSAKRQHLFITCLTLVSARSIQCKTCLKLKKQEGYDNRCWKSGAAGLKKCKSARNLMSYVVLKKILLPCVRALDYHFSLVISKLSKQYHTLLGLGFQFCCSH